MTVGVRQRPPIEYHSHSCDDTWCDTTQYDSLKGGIRLDYSHSSTCKVSYDGTDHLMCAAHAVTDCGSTTPSTTVEHEGTDIGDVVDHDPEQDWAVIEHDGNFDRISALIAGHEIEVNGYISEQGLQDMKSNGDYAHHRGAKTCTTKGPVERVGIDLPYDSDCEGQGHYVEIDNCTYGGDSGAPTTRPGPTPTAASGPRLWHPTRAGRTETADTASAPRPTRSSIPTPSRSRETEHKRRRSAER